MTTIQRWAGIASATLVFGCGTSSTTSKAATGGGAGGTAGAAAAPGGNSNSGGGASGGASSASQVAQDGYITADPWMGYGFTATDPGAATITPDCTTSCVPPFAGHTFCMQGTVTGRSDYSGFAMLGWNVNQAQGGDPATWAVPATGGITVTVTDTPTSVALRVQLQGTDPHSGADRWCAPLVNGQFIAWSDFKTNCWSGGTPQDPLAAGTPIQQAAIMVPGLLTDLNFDVCLVNVVITP